MQEVAPEPAAGRRPVAQQQFTGVDLRRPKGYAAAPPPTTAEGEPCPRCESRDTKFCYYNNYNTAQPRHFCKGCRRYWTKGGTLRNVPVGGGTRKKPSSTSSTSSSPASAYAAAAKPKRPYKKKRRVAPPPEPAAVPAASPAEGDSATKTAPTTLSTTDSAKATTTTTTTDAASEITTELLVPTAAATEDDSLTHLLQADDDAVALGLGLSDLPSCKSAALLEPDSFEWPASFDLGACWPPAGGFLDPVDPALFLNLP